MYVGTTLNGGNPVRLIPFIFNETGLGQSYVLEFGNQYIAFYQNGGVVISAPNTPYTIVSPYLQADLADLQFAQCADIVTIVNKNYPIHELARIGPTNWMLTQNNLQNNGIIVTGLNGTGGGIGALTYQYFVSAVDGNGTETVNGALAEQVQGSINAPSPTNPITLSWNGMQGAVLYRIYVGIGTGSPQIGFLGSTPSTSFTDTGILPDYSQLPPTLNQGIGANFGFYPAVVGFVQQRRAFGNTVANPIGFYLSRTGAFSDFNVYLTSDDSAPIFGSLAGEEVNAIEHLVELKFMLMLTSGAEIYVQGNGSGVVTPSAINAATQSQYGASPLKILKVGDVLLFNQALGSFIRDFVFDFVIDGYRGNDITMFSSHLFEGHQIVDWAYQKTPDSIIWAVREDGVLLSCTYVREQQILAWARHDFTNGFVENVCAIPENGEYAVYASIRRIINGSTVRYIERISSRIWLGPVLAVAIGTANAIGDPINAPFSDCSAQFDGRNTMALTMNLQGPITIVEGVNDGIAFGGNTAGVPYYFAQIPAGIYSASTLAAAMTTAINTAYGSSSYVVIVSGGKFVIGPGSAPGVIFFLTQPNDPNFSRSAKLTLGFQSFNYSAGSGGTADAEQVPVTIAFQNGNTSYQQQLILTSSAAYFGSGQTAQVGDQIFLQDSDWISSQGKEGNQIRCTIQSISSSTVAIVTPSGIVPAEFQGQAITIWARAVATVSGLTFLAGQKVSVWADRFVVGSPLNKQISTIYTVPPSGILTLDKCYSVIYVGLPMVADLETLAIDTSFGDSIMGERKAVSRLTIYIYNTRGFFGGTQNPDTDPDNLVGGVVQDPLFNLTENKAEANRQFYSSPLSLMTEWQVNNVDCNWSKEGRIFIRNVDPVPLSILAVVPAGLTSAKVAWSQKV